MFKLPNEYAGLLYQPVPKIVTSDNNGFIRMQYRRLCSVGSLATNGGSVLAIVSCFNNVDSAIRASSHYYNFVRNVTRNPLNTDLEATGLVYCLGVVSSW